MSRSLLKILIISIACGTSIARAQEVIIEQPGDEVWVEYAPPNEGGWPDFNNSIVGDTAALLEAGEFEITFGASLEDEDDLQTTELYIQLEYGVTDWFEFSFEAPYNVLHPKPNDEKQYDGFADVVLGGAVPVWIDHPLFVAFQLDVSLPTGNEDRSGGELGEGYVVWEPSLAADWALGPFDEITVEFGGEISKVSQRIFNYEVIYAHAIQHIGPFEEFVTSLGIEGSLDGDEKELSIVPGVGFPIAPDIEFGLEGAAGLTRDTANWRIGFEVTFEF